MAWGKTKEEKKAEKEKSELKGKVKAAGKAYINLKASLNVDKLMNGREKEIQLYNLIMMHYQELERFKAYYPDGDYGSLDTHAIYVIMKDYDYFMKHGLAAESTSILGSIVSQADKANGGNGELAPAEDKLEQGVSGAQQEGLRQIAMWMYRNSFDTGLAGSIGLNSSQERFVRHILDLPARVKLLMYYMVEKKARHDLNSMHIMESQTSYVPDLAKFKEQMLASKFFVFKRVKGNYVYWEKLEEALAKARECMPTIALYGELGNPDNITREADKDPAQVAANSNDPNAKLAAQRDILMQTFFKRALDYRKLLELKESGKKIKSGELTSAKARMMETFINMAEVDKQMEAKILHTPEKDNTDIDAGEFFEEAAGWVSEQFAQEGMYSEYKGLAEDLNIPWHLGDLDLGAVDGICSTVSGIMAFMSSMFSIYNLARVGSELSGMDLADKIMDILTNLSDIASTLTGGIYGLKEVTAVTEAAANAVSKAGDVGGGAASAVVGGLNMGAGLFKITKVNQEAQAMSRARRKFNGDTTLSDEDKEKIAAIEGLQDRIANAQAESAGYQVLQGALQLASGILTATGVGAPIAAVLTIAGSVVGLVSSVREYINRRKNHDATIDTYIHMDDIWQLIYNSLPESNAAEAGAHGVLYGKLPTQKEAASRKGMMLEQIRLEVAASLGFATKESLYNHITGTYAQFLYAKTFFKDCSDIDNPKDPVLEDEVTVTGRRGKKEVSPDKERGYADMLRSFGLKLKYPQTANELPLPGVDAIAAKMDI